MTGLLSEYVDRAGLAAELGVSERTICRYEAERDGLPMTRIGGRAMYRLSSVRQWLERRERRPNPTRGNRAA